MTKRIPLTKGQFAIVDDDDWLELASHNWFCVNGYAGRNYPRNTRILMHRVIANAPDGMQVDHINHNTLDNRKSNLRLCTLAENNRNHRMARNNRSGYIGVAWAQSHKKWKAYIHYMGKIVNIGFYDDILEAARAHDRKAIELHGEFASLNFPDSSPL